MSSSILFQDSVSSNNNLGFGGVPRTVLEEPSLIGKSIAFPGVRNSMEARTLVFTDPVAPVRNSMDDEIDALIADSGIEILDDIEAGPRM